MYHYVRDVAASAHPGIAARSIADFEGQVEHLLRHYEPVEPTALLECVDTGAPLPPNGFVLTFDDGIRDHWDHVLPVLLRHGLHGIFGPIGLPYLEGRIAFAQKNQFVRGQIGEDRLPDIFIEAAAEVAPSVDVAGLIEGVDRGQYRRGSEKYLRFKHAVNRHIPLEVSSRVMDRLFAEHICTDERAFIDELYLSVEEIVALSRMGHTIAAHSISHRSLPMLSDDEQEREITHSLGWLEGLLGAPLRWFNYPYGDHNQQSERIVERLGVAIAYSTRPPLPWSAHEDRFRVPRVDTYHLPLDHATPPVELRGHHI